MRRSHARHSGLPSGGTSQVLAAPCEGKQRSLFVRLSEQLRLLAAVFGDLCGR